MTWKELKELAEEAGVTDETELDISVLEGEPKDNMVSHISDGIWFVV